MTATTKDRSTQQQYAEVINVPVLAAAKINAGAIVVATAAGFAAPGSTATTLSYIGRAEDAVDNTAGANGAKSVNVRRKQAFKWANDGTITQANLMLTAYIVDDQTVAATNGGATRSIAGRIVGVDTDGVWIE
jgi:hypothetical protein